MPIIKDSAPFHYPDKDFVLVKYMDLQKFLSLLYKKSLFFCRLDKLEDQFEGITAKKNYELRIQIVKQLNKEGIPSKPLNELGIHSAVQDQYKWEERYKGIFLINCWNKFNVESAALWKIYSNNGKGILIKSSVERIKKAFKQIKAPIRMSKVKYLNYETEYMPEGNIYYPIIHKQKAYLYEEEVRLIHEITEDIVDGAYDWSKEEVQAGKYFECNLEELVEEIIMGPYSPKWIYNLLQDLLEKYNLSKNIRQSTLAI